MAYLDKAALEAAGFSDTIEERAASVVVNVAGLEGSGKTHWSLTAPKPLFYMGTDFGEQGVIQKANGQVLRIKNADGSPRSYKLAIPHEYRAFVDREEKEEERKVREGKLANFAHRQFYVPFYEDYAKAIKAGVRTVVWDNAADVWEYIRMSVFGREASNRQDLQTEANSKFKEMVRLASLNNVNLILINHLKPKWEKVMVNGQIKNQLSETEHEMKGFDWKDINIPQLVALNLWTKFTPPGQYEMVVKKCRDNAPMVGLTVPAQPFVELMQMLVPGVSSERWEA